MDCSAEMVVDCRPTKTNLVSTNVIRHPIVLMNPSHFSLVENIVFSFLFFRGIVFFASKILSMLLDLFANNGYRTDFLPSLALSQPLKLPTHVHIKHIA